MKKKYNRHGTSGWGDEPRPQSVDTQYQHTFSKQDCKNIAVVIGSIILVIVLAVVCLSSLLNYIASGAYLSHPTDEEVLGKLEKKYQCEFMILAKEKDSYGDIHYVFAPQDDPDFIFYGSSVRFGMTSSFGVPYAPTILFFDSYAIGRRDVVYHEVSEKFNLTYKSWYLSTTSDKTEEELKQKNSLFVDFYNGGLSHSSGFWIYITEDTLDEVMEKMPFVVLEFQRLAAEAENSSVGEYGIPSGYWMNWDFAYSTEEGMKEEEMEQFNVGKYFDDSNDYTWEQVENMQDIDELSKFFRDFHNYIVLELEKLENS